MIRAPRARSSAGGTALAEAGGAAGTGIRRRPPARGGTEHAVVAGGGFEGADGGGADGDDGAPGGAGTVDRGRRRCGDFVALGVQGADLVERRVVGDGERGEGAQAEVEGDGGALD